MTEKTFRTSFFKSRTDITPVTLDMTWDALTQRLSKYDFRTDKDGPLFSPAEYAPGTTRAAKNVLQMHFLCLDFDNVHSEDFASALKALAGVQLCYYATWSSPKAVGDAVHMRLIVALSRPVPAAQWPEFFEKASAKFGGKNDQGCKNAAHMFYLPSMPVGSEKEAFFDARGGEPLDVDAIPAEPKAGAGDLLATAYLKLEHVEKEIADVRVLLDGLTSAEPEADPVFSYLESLKWDGVERVRNWAATYLGTPPYGKSPLTGFDHAEHGRTVAAAWFVQAVSRVYKPGCAADLVLVLGGPQGVGKTAAFKILGGEWYTDSINFKKRDTCLDLQGRWIVDLCEFDFMHGTASTGPEFMAFISTRDDFFREPYAKQAKSHLRRCVFVGTVNGGVSAGRRIRSVEVRAVDTEALVRDRDQLWAEAVVMMKAGSPPWFDSKVQQFAEQEDKAARELLFPWSRRDYDAV